MRFVTSLVLLLSVGTAIGQQPEPPVSAPTQPQSATAGIGFATVAEALETLRAKAGLQIMLTKPDAWTIINEPDNVQWSFTPKTHKAFPAVVRRATKVNSEGYVYIEMSALCQAEKVHCDKLIEEFKELNESIRQSVRTRLQQAPK